MYDAENRLIQVGPAGSPAVGDRRLTFTYDYRGRRVGQTGSTWMGASWVTAFADARVFVWDDWKMLLEHHGTPHGPPPPTRAYTWGLDLAGQRSAGRGGRSNPQSLLEGAGTIGGLLAVADGTGGAGTFSYVYCYDANGNVSQVVDPAAANVTAALVATYEYDPYGGVAASAGAYAATNPVRFSTKYWDDPTGLGYWGYRFYRADLGRWVNRDPIGERGGANLLTYGANQAVTLTDALGLTGRDPKYGLPDAFWHWVHGPSSDYKGPGGVISREAAMELYEEWLELGRPDPRAGRPRPRPPRGGGGGEWGRFLNVIGWVLIIVDMAEPAYAPELPYYFYPDNPVDAPQDADVPVDDGGEPSISPENPVVGQPPIPGIECPNGFSPHLVQPGDNCWDLWRKRCNKNIPWVEAREQCGADANSGNPNKLEPGEAICVPL
ncbi:MAG: RHS repeat-associated core domain-containing protein [Lentisphaerae bacterium]|nr:RHS repeat-associated core domain-containing protein [Lentisphaerota bacterium]